MPTISVHVDDDVFHQVGVLADQLDRSKSWVVSDALRPYLDHHRWMIAETLQTLDEVRAGKAVLRDHAGVAADILDYARSLDTCK